MNLIGKLMFAGIGVSAALTCFPAYKAFAADFSLFQHRDDPVIEAPADITYAEPLTLTEENGLFYCIDANGVKCIGEQTIDGQAFLFDATGVMMTGWQEINGVRRFFDPETGLATEGMFTWRGETYLVTQENGKFCGTYDENGSLYYFDSYGILQHNGLFEMTDGALAYAKADGTLAVGIYTDENGKRFLGDKDGKLLTGFQTTDGSTRFFSPRIGEELLGFTEIDNSTYYFDAKNGMLTGVQTIDSDIYCFDENGIMQTEWLEIAGKHCYFDKTSGKLYNGLLTIDGKTYYLNGLEGTQSGVVNVGDSLLLFDENGCLASGQITLKDGICLADAEGHPLSGWQLLGDNYYYFNEDTYFMATSTTVDGYVIREDGTAHTELYDKVDKILASVEQTPDALYAYVTKNYRYKKIEQTRTRDEINKVGWDTFVASTIANRVGVCYYLAATLDYFMHMCGYETRIVHATHSTGDHYWNQVLINGKWLNYDPTYSNRGNIAWNTIIARGTYTVYGYITVNYDERGTYLGTDFKAYQ